MVIDIVFEPLDTDHDRENFECGNEALDRFLKQQARQKQSKNNAVTHVAVNRLYTRSGFGEIILRDLFKRAIELSEEIGCYLIDVDVKHPSLKRFYHQYGITEFKDQSLHMFITLETIKKLFQRELTDE